MIKLNLTPFANLTRNLGIAALCLFGVTAQASEQPLLQHIRIVETKGDYNNHSADTPLVQMTVGEVMEWQATAKGAKSTAVGAYNLNRMALARAIAQGNIDKDALFDTKTQDEVATLLIGNCSAAHRRADVGFANCLAATWAGLPLVSGRKRGQTAFGNPALTTPDQILAVIARTAHEYPSVQAPSE